MKKWKRALSLLLVAVMAIGLAGCGGSKNNINANEEAKKYVYRLKDIDTGSLFDDVNVQDVLYANGRIYALTGESYWEEMTGWVINLVSMNEDGSDMQTVEIMSTLRENPDWMQWEEPDEGDMDGGIAVPLTSDVPVPNEESESEEDEDDVDMPVDTEEPESEVREYSDTYISRTKLTENNVYLVVESNSYSIDAMGNYMSGESTLVMYIYDLNGEKQGELTLNDDPDSYMWVREICADQNGNAAICLDEEVWICDVTGKVISKIPVDTQSFYMETALIDKEGYLDLICYNNEWTKITAKRYNMQTGAAAEDIELPGSLTNFGLQPGRNWDFFMTNSNGVFGYNIGDEEATQIVSYINSDIDNSTISSIYEMEEGKLAVTYRDDDWNMHMAVGTYVPPEEIPDKQAIMIACSYLSWSMRRRVVAFNKESELYRIVVNDYSIYNTQEDYSAGVTKLNNDIISGQVPDILVLSSDMPVDSYIAKGLFADIGKMIEADEELNLEDYMANVFEAYSVNGKLYSIIPAFNISTVMAKTADVGETPGWTLADLKALMEARPESGAFGMSTTRSEVLWQIMRYSGSRFVDRESGKCHFDTQEFIDMLEFVAQFPEEFDWDNEGEDFWKDYDTQYRSGKTLLMPVTIGDFSSYLYWAHGQFGEPVTLIGFPAEEGIGAVINAENQYVISAKSANKEGAWEFLRYYLTEEYQKGDEMYGMPVLREAALEKLERAKERPYWENEDGTKEYYDMTYWIGDERIIIDPLSDEEADDLLAYVESVTMSNYYDESLSNIISEEADAFFKGDKTAEEVAKIIQSRAQVYINESR
ncbi:MAG: extracellular solute-binding protein [Lachnospiraceae bacterium]|nr:extracellular solute-binding protein [Lachnospiraceae bacterium]